MTKHSPGSLSIAYILYDFPSVSETFILHELLELQKQGVPLVVYAVRPPRASLTHPELASLRADIVYLNRPVPILTGMIYCLVHFPRPFLSLLIAGLLSRDLKTLKISLWVGPLVRSVQRRGVRLLHAHFAAQQAELARLVSEMLGTPYGFTAHAQDIFVPSYRKRLAGRIQAARYIITISDYNKSYLRKLFPDLAQQIAARARTIHMGVSPDAIASHPPQPRALSANEPATLLTVGRLTEKKGHMVMVRALKMLRQRGIPVRWVVAGEGPERPALDQAVIQAALSDVALFVGAVNSKTRMDWLTQSHVFVLPCVVARNGDMDGIPVALMEAMAAGVPVISTSLSGIPELITDSQEGLLVPPGDAVALADAVETMLNRPDLRAACSVVAWQKVKREFSVSTNVQQLLDIFVQASAQD